jgi:hypothetical protein
MAPTPHPALRATFSPREKETRPFSRLREKVADAVGRMRAGSA